MEKRISKDKYYLQIAKTVAQRSPCIRRQFGAIIVKDDVIVSTGYNGPARGVINCTEIGCLKDEMDLPHYSGYEHCPAVHAEENCVSENSLIIESDGTIREAKNVHSGLLSLDKDNFNLVPATAKRLERNKKKVIRIETEGKFSIEVSPEHLMFVSDPRKFLRTKKAASLTEKDYLPVVTKIRVKGSPKKLPEVSFDSYKLEKEGIKVFQKLRDEKGITWRSLAKRCEFSCHVISRLINEKGIRKKNKKKILEVFPSLEKHFVGNEKEVTLPIITNPKFCQIAGYFAGNGSVHKNYIQFADQDEETLKSYQKLCKEVFGIGGNIHRKENNYALLVCSKRISLLFKKLNFKKMEKREIPAVFHGIEDESLAAFLRGLFDAEGTVGTRSIHLDSSSKKIIETLRLLLLRFGILSSVFKYKKKPILKDKKKPGITYSLQFSGLDLHRFYEKINFSAKSKKLKLEKEVKKTENVSRKRKFLREWFKGKIPTTGFSSLRHRYERVEYDTVKKIIKGFVKYGVDEEKIKRFKNLVEGITFLKIKKLEHLDKEVKMIDFFVPGYNSFIANGFIVHNCIINAARHGANVLNGIMFVCGQNFKDKSIVESRPCGRCKRIIINAGIKEVVTMNENGNIMRYNVKDWVEEDSKAYIESLKKIKDKN